MQSQCVFRRAPSIPKCPERPWTAVAAAVEKALSTPFSLPTVIASSITLHPEEDLINPGLKIKRGGFGIVGLPISHTEVARIHDLSDELDTGIRFIPGHDLELVRNNPMFTEMLKTTILREKIGSLVAELDSSTVELIGLVTVPNGQQFSWPANSSLAPENSVAYFLLSLPTATPLSKVQLRAQCEHSDQIIDIPLGPEDWTKFECSGIAWLLQAHVKSDQIPRPQNDTSVLSESGGFVGLLFSVVVPSHVVQQFRPFGEKAENLSYKSGLAAAFAKWKREFSSEEDSPRKLVHVLSTKLERAQNENSSDEEDSDSDTNTPTSVDISSLIPPSLMDYEDKFRLQVLSELADEFGFGICLADLQYEQVFSAKFRDDGDDPNDADYEEELDHRSFYIDKRSYKFLCTATDSIKLEDSEQPKPGWKLVDVIKGFGDFRWDLTMDSWLVDDNEIVPRDPFKDISVYSEEYDLQRYPRLSTMELSRTLRRKIVFIYPQWDLISQHEVLIDVFQLRAACDYLSKTDWDDISGAENQVQTLAFTLLSHLNKRAEHWWCVNSLLIVSLRLGSSELFESLMSHFPEECSIAAWGKAMKKWGVKNFIHKLQQRLQNLEELLTTCAKVDLRRVEQQVTKVAVELYNSGEQEYTVDWLKTLLSKIFSRDPVNPTLNPTYLYCLLHYPDGAAHRMGHEAFGNSFVSLFQNYYHYTEFWVQFLERCARQRRADDRLRLEFPENYYCDSGARLWLMDSLDHVASSLYQKHGPYRIDELVSVSDSNKCESWKVNLLFLCAQNNLHERVVELLPVPSPPTAKDQANRYLEKFQLLVDQLSKRIFQHLSPEEHHHYIPFLRSVFTTYILPARCDPPFKYRDQIPPVTDCNCNECRCLNAFLTSKEKSNKLEFIAFPESVRQHLNIQLRQHRERYPVFSISQSGTGEGKNRIPVIVVTKNKDMEKYGRKKAFNKWRRESQASVFFDVPGAMMEAVLGEEKFRLMEAALELVRNVTEPPIYSIDEDFGPVMLQVHYQGTQAPADNDNDGGDGGRGAGGGGGGGGSGSSSNANNGQSKKRKNEGQEQHLQSSPPPKRHQQRQSAADINDGQKQYRQSSPPKRHQQRQSAADIVRERSGGEGGGRGREGGGGGRRGGGGRGEVPRFSLPSEATTRWGR